MPSSSGRCSSSDSPIAPPRNSARSVAIAAISETPHIASTAGRAKWMRQSAGRLSPVTSPTRADSSWNSIATALAASTHPDQRHPVAGARLDVGREIAGIHVGDRGHHGGARQQERRPRPAPAARQHLADRARHPARRPPAPPCRRCRPQKSPAASPSPSHPTFHDAAQRDVTRSGLGRAFAAVPFGLEGALCAPWFFFSDRVRRGLS